MTAALDLLEYDGIISINELTKLVSPASNLAEHVLVSHIVVPFGADGVGVFVAVFL